MTATQILSAGPHLLRLARVGGLEMFFILRSTMRRMVSKVAAGSIGNPCANVDLKLTLPSHRTQLLHQTLSA